jgi:phosphoheptose isomerase
VGTGPDAAVASRVAARLTGTGITVRSLTSDAATMTAIANDYGFDQVYARQLSALAQEGDVLLVLACGALPASLREAVAVAAEAGVRVLTVSGVAQADGLGGRSGADELIEAIFSPCRTSKVALDEGQLRAGPAGRARAPGVQRDRSGRS